MNPETDKQWALLDVPDDARELAENGACACGHAALAAALRRRVVEVMPAFHSQGSGLWVNQRRMQAALATLAGGWRVNPSEQAWQNGPNLIWIQGTGSWMRPGVPHGARNQRTHWVTTLEIDGDAWVYDINHDDYLPKPIWENHILALLLHHWKADGWEIRAVLTPTTSK